MIDRKVTVRFDANVGPGLPWSFEPEQNSIEVKLGEVVTVNYRVINQAARPITASAAYNVAPLNAGAYFQKINCFCFTEQTLKAGETRDMAVVFYVDPSMAKDPDGNEINTITLSYTFYPQREPSRPVADGTPSGTGQANLLTETEMADAHAKPHHDYHLVDPSPWPAVGSISAFVMAVGAIAWMHHMFSAAPLVFGAGVIGVLYTMLSWWRDVIKEAEHQGDHTRVVQISHRYGMILFIASEVMFFVAWFWAYFDVALFPADAHQVLRGDLIGHVWPPAPAPTARSAAPSIPGICRCSTR